MTRIICYHVFRLATEYDKGLTFDGIHSTKQKAQDWINDYDSKHADRYKVVKKTHEIIENDANKLILKGFEKAWLEKYT